MEGRLPGLFQTASTEQYLASKWVYFEALIAYGPFFLYVAFFSTLSSSTISVIESLALERAKLGSSAAIVA
jgi:hypothetical protein